MQKNFSRNEIYKGFYLATSIGVLFITAHLSSAAPLEDLQAEIANRAAEIVRLEEEIKGYHIQLDKIGSDKLSLQNEIKLI